MTWICEFWHKSCQIIKFKKDNREKYNILCHKRSKRYFERSIVGDGTSYSEGGSCGSNQSSKIYSPYSACSAQSKDSLFAKGGDADYVARKKAILKESRNRLDREYLCALPM